jgi:hypothetical protein
MSWVGVRGILERGADQIQPEDESPAVLRPIRVLLHNSLYGDQAALSVRTSLTTGCPLEPAMLKQINNEPHGGPRRARLRDAAFDRSRATAFEGLVHPPSHRRRGRGDHPAQGRGRRADEVWWCNARRGGHASRANRRVHDRYPSGAGGRWHAVLHCAGQVGEPEPGGDADLSRRRGSDQYDTRRALSCKTSIVKTWRSLLLSTRHPTLHSDH